MILSNLINLVKHMLRLQNIMCLKAQMLGLLLFFCARLVGQTPTGASYIQSRLDTGFHAKYACVHRDVSFTRSGNDTSSTQYQIELQVLGKDDTATYMLARYSNITSDTGMGIEGKFFAGMLEGMTVIYQTNPAGRLIRIRNVEDLKFSFLSNYTARLAEFPKDSKEMQVLGTLKPFVTSDQFVLQSTEEIPLLQYFYDNTFRYDTVNISASLFPNPYRDSAFPSITQTWVGETEPNQQFVLTQISNLDYDKGKEIIINTLSRLFEETGYQTPDIKTLLQILRINETLVTKMQLPNGWVTELTFIKSHYLGASGTSTITSMQLVE